MGDTGQAGWFNWCFSTWHRRPIQTEMAQPRTTPDNAPATQGARVNAAGAAEPPVPAGRPEATQLDELFQEVVDSLRRIEADYGSLRVALERLQASVRARPAGLAGSAPLPTLQIAPPDKVDELLQAELFGEVADPIQDMSQLAVPDAAVARIPFATDGEANELLAREFEADGARPGSPLAVIPARGVEQVVIGVATASSTAGAIGASGAQVTRSRSARVPDTYDVDARLDLLLRSLINREFLPESAVPEWYSRLRRRDRS